MGIRDQGEKNRQLTLRLCLVANANSIIIRLCYREPQESDFQGSSPLFLRFSVSFMRRCTPNNNYSKLVSFANILHTTLVLVLKHGFERRAEGSRLSHTKT